MSFQLKNIQQSSTPFLLSILPATTTDESSTLTSQFFKIQDLSRGPTRFFVLTRRHQVFIIFITGCHPDLHSLSRHDLKSLSMSLKQKLMTGQDTEIRSLSVVGL